MRRYLIALIIINVLAFLYGLVYYDQQLRSTSPLLWIFTIDCPLYALFMAAVFGLAASGRRLGTAFNFIASAGALKYGLWTIFVLLFYGDFFFAPALFTESAILFVGHIGLVLEGLLLIGTSGIDRRVLAMAIMWFAVNDWFDYEVGIHPFLPESAAKLGTVALLTVAASLVIPALAFLAWNKQRNFYGWNRFLTKLRNAAGR